MKNKMFEDSVCKVNPIQHLLEVDTWNINQKLAFKIYSSLLYTIHNTTYIQLLHTIYKTMYNTLLHFYYIDFFS